VADSKLQEKAKTLNEKFKEDLRGAFEGKFGVEIDTGYNVLANALMSTRKDEEDFTPEQQLFLEAFQAGYFMAMLRAIAVK